MDFTLDKYSQLCAAIGDSKYYPTVTVADYLKDPRSPGIMLRHDVDRKPGNARLMARVEAEHGLSATYYVRSIPACFDEALLRALAAAGHEVGYHYETLSQANGDAAQALRLFERDLARFRSIVPVQTVCMHGSPLSRWNNLDLWRHSRLADFGLVGEPYLSLNFDEIKYLSDTGRTWHSRRFNVRDRVSGRANENQREIETTDELIALINSRECDRLMIHSHPNRWAANGAEWLVESAADWFINYGKLIVAGFQRQTAN